MNIHHSEEFLLFEKRFDKGTFTRGEWIKYKKGRSCVKEKRFCLVLKSKDLLELCNIGDVARKWYMVSEESLLGILKGLKDH